MDPPAFTLKLAVPPATRVWPAGWVIMLGGTPLAVEVTQTEPVADSDPETAITLKGPPALIAVKSPLLSIVPPPLTDQAGVTVMRLPN